MDGQDKVDQNTEQNQSNVSNTNPNNIGTNTGNPNQVQPNVVPTNTTDVSAVNNNSTPAEQPLTPNVEATTNSNDIKKDNSNKPKSQAEAVSNSDEVDTSGNLISASEAGVGTSTSMKTKEELTKKDKLLDGLPGIGVPVKNENNTNSNPNPNNENTQVEQVTSEKVSTKKKVQYFFTVVFFILVGVFIYFLPVISEILTNTQEKEEVIKTGFLVCNLETNKKDVTTTIQDRFGFSNEKLETYKVEREVSTSSAKDPILSDNDKECETLYEQTKALSGVDVDCKLKGKTQKITQSIDYNTINISKVTSAFTEAGGTYPDYKLGQSIKKIENDMKQSGFICKRSKT